MNQRLHRAFTLIEPLVVIAIIAAPNFNVYGYSATEAPQNYGVWTTETMNGDLNFYSTAAVSSPVLTVMFWSGVLENAWRGRTMASPILNGASGVPMCTLQIRLGFRSPSPIRGF